MKQLHQFDEVFDSQKTFRVLLEVMANPFRIRSVADAAEKMYGEFPQTLAVAMTMLDNEATYYVCDNAEVSEQIKLLTHAEPVEMSEADFIFVMKQEQLAEVLAQAKIGTLEDPHKSATIIVEDDGDRTCPAVFYGPGIHEEAEVLLSATMEEAVCQRDAQQYEYPQGIDYIFLNKQSDVWCIPRLVLRRK